VFSAQRTAFFNNFFDIIMDKFTLARIISEHIQDDELTSFSLSDWDTLIRISQKEGIGPLVYWILSNSKKLSFAPGCVRNDLRTIYSTTWLQNQRIFKELKVFSHLYTKAQISVAALKGACFALTIYPDIGLRPMADLDLLILDPKITQAVQIAKSEGYVEIIPDVYPGLTKFLKDEFTLVKRGKDSIALELHNSLLQNTLFTYSVPTDWFWQQTMPLEGSNHGRFENLLMLTPEANILYVAAHTILKHGPRGAILRQYYDLDRLISLNGDRLNWDLVINQANKFEWSSALHEALTKTHEYFDTLVPANVFTDLSKITDRHQSLIARMKTEPKSRVLEEYQNILALKWYGRILVFLELLVPGPTYMRWRYKLKNAWSLPWYYLVRWFGIIKDGFRTLLVLFEKR
jgi:hypothetical protein